MRWTYLIPRLIILGMIWAFMAFGFDPLLRYSATQTVQSITGARADIAHLQTGFFPPAVSVRSVALASHRKPGTNLMQFDEMRLTLAGDPLLRKSFVVDEAVVTGVRFGTSRNDNGQLDIEDASESAEPTIPPWLTEKLKDAGDRWLEDFMQQAERQLDPNVLESYRVGNELYAKWDARFDEMNQRVSAARAELETLRQQIDAARKGEAIEQVEKYLEVARRADLLVRQSQTLLEQFQTSVPVELRSDFARLDQAQKNDRAMAVDAIQMLKPDPRRITESLIGEQMYLQLQQMLSWVEMLKAYQDDLKAPPPPERSRGRDFSFPVLNPTPRVLCRRMLLSGELMLSKTPTPFSAVLTDVTSDPKTHGRPALLQVSTSGAQPIELVVRHDATTDISRTDLGVNYVDSKTQRLTAGRPEGDHLVAAISNLHWTARLTLTEGNISGQIEVRSDFERPEVQVRNKHAQSLAGLAEQTLAGITTVNATLAVDGPLRRPDIAVTSNLGDQVVAGFETAFSAFLPQLQAQLTQEVGAYVDRQKQEFSAKYGARYSELLARHQNIIDGLNQAQSLAMELRSGNVDPEKVFRLASETGLLKENDQKKVDRYMERSNDVLKGLERPEQTIQDALPSLRKKLFR
ncbi:MAG: TIGR03545 family protein [Fuerstiella sp.]